MIIEKLLSLWETCAAITETCIIWLPKIEINIHIIINQDFISQTLLFCSEDTVRKENICALCFFFGGGGTFKNLI